MNHKYFRNIFSTIMALAVVSSLSASSHREAPLISNDPLADNADVYAFRSPDDTTKITLIATYVPLQSPQGGPNYYSFGENIRYEIHVDNDASVSGDEVTYRFTFSKTNGDPSTFFNIRLGAENLKTTYTLERSLDGGSTFSTILSNGTVPPPNIGPRSIDGGAGLGMTYTSLFNSAIMTASTGETVFCGTADDPFFVDLGGVFDLGDMPRQSGTPKDGLKCLNVSVIAIQVDIATLQKTGQPVTAATNILDPNFVIGVWASASRQQVRTLNPNGTTSYSGAWVQVSRLGMPLTNEAVVPIGNKDLWNSLTPYQDLANLSTFGNYFYNPELALYMDDSQFGGAVPAFAQLRVQSSSLQGFDFRNGHNGLYGLKGNVALNGTALDDAIFGTLLLPAPNSPRSVDLWPIFHTGVPNLAPYHLATGKGGNPLANGKPFINNFLPNGGDMLRLNMAVPVTPRNHPNFSSEGLVSAAVLGLTDPTYASTSTLQWIPNMDGFPNGRRLEDDVTRIELQAVGGVVLAAIGLWYDDYTAGGPNPVTQDLIDVLTYSTGVNANDASFSSTFPYVAMPWRGTSSCGGRAVAFTQAALLAPSAMVMVGTLSTSMYCPGGMISIPFTTSGTFSGNTFTAQLSNASGSFVSGTTTLGTLALNGTNPSGTIMGTVNTAISAGAGYRVRLMSSSPAITSADNGMNLTIFASPMATITAAGPSTFCSNMPTTLNANGGMVNYVWKLSTATVQSGASASYVPMASGNHTVTVTDANGCMKTSVATVITRNLSPATNAGADKSVCAGSSVLIGGNSAVAYTYSWVPTTGLSNPAIAKPMATPMANMTYTLYATQNGCTTSDMVDVTALALPATPSITSMPSGNLFILTPSGIPMGNTANWFRNGAGLYSNRPYNATISVYAGPNAYTLKSKGANGCLSMASAAVNVRVGGGKDGNALITFNAEDMRAYPNPTEGILNVELSNLDATSGSLVIYNTLGQVVLAKEVVVSEGKVKEQLDLTNLSKGIYSLSFVTENGQRVQKIVKE